MDPMGVGLKTPKKTGNTMEKVKKKRLRIFAQRARTKEAKLQVKSLELQVARWAVMTAVWAVIELSNLFGSILNSGLEIPISSDFVSMYFGVVIAFSYDEWLLVTKKAGELRVFRRVSTLSCSFLGFYCWPHLR